MTHGERGNPWRFRFRHVRSFLIVVTHASIVVLGAVSVANGGVLKGSPAKKWLVLSLLHHDIDVEIQLGYDLFWIKKKMAI